MYVLSQKLTGPLTKPQIFLCFYFRGYSLRVADDDADELKVLLILNRFHIKHSPAKHYVDPYRPFSLRFL